LMCYILQQARREPQRGPGKHYRGALPPHSVCVEIETPKASRGRKRGERCPLTIRLGVRGSVVSFPSGARGRAPGPKMDFMHILGQKEAIRNTIFSVFLSDGGAPQTSRGPEKLSPLPPLDGPVLQRNVAKVLLFSVVSVRCFLCLSVNTITHEPLGLSSPNFQNIVL